MLDLSKTLGALRVTCIPKEGSPVIPLPIALQLSTPSAPPSRVLKQRNRDLPRRCTRQPQPDVGPIAERTRSKNISPVSVQSPIVKTVEEKSIARRTRSHQANITTNVTPYGASRRQYLQNVLLDLAMPVLHEEMGKTLEYGQL